MGKKPQYQQISAFWTMVLPAIVFGLLYYAYNSPGWLSTKVQGMLNPIVQPVLQWARSAFG